MSDKSSRDPELDLLLAPLRRQQMNDDELSRMLTQIMAQQLRQKWWVPLAFAAGLSIGVGGTLYLSSHPTTPVESNFSIDEFATVHQVITNY